MYNNSGLLSAVIWKLIEHLRHFDMGYHHFAPDVPGTVFPFHCFDDLVNPVSLNSKNMSSIHSIIELIHFLAMVAVIFFFVSSLSNAFCVSSESHHLPDAGLEVFFAYFPF